VAKASATHVSGLNYLKSGEDPAIGPDDAYPAWLPGILEPKESLGEFERRIAGLKENGEDWRETFSEADKARYTKLARLARMKANNTERAKK
jgi:large subunit ribosomal protein L54